MSPYIKSSISKRLREKAWRLTNGDSLNGTCYVCKNVLYFNNFEVGHIIAEVNGGSTSIENLRAVCRPCNRSCGTNNMDAFKKTMTLNSDKEIDKVEVEYRLRLYLDIL